MRNARMYLRRWCDRHFALREIGSNKSSTRPCDVHAGGGSRSERWHTCAASLMVWIRLFCAAAAFSVAKEASSHNHLRNPSLRSTKPAQQPDRPLPPVRPSSETEGANINSFLLESAAPRSRTQPTCRCRFRELCTRSTQYYCRNQAGLLYNTGYKRGFPRC